jgi:hypothetical protein
MQHTQGESTSGTEHLCRNCAITIHVMEFIPLVKSLWTPVFCMQIRTMLGMDGL